ncbi:MAG: GAF domain-containing sensor histidine kinase [Gemmatimonadota bacterium]
MHETGLVDAPVEATFDAFARLAVSLLKAPVAFLSLVDANSDFYVSQRGMPEPVASLRRMTGRSFCHYAIVNSAPLVINDTHQDPEYRAVPTVDSLGVRSYLGAPVTVDDQVVGSLCVVGFEPRDWTPTDIETLVELGRSASREIELRAAIRAANAETLRARALARANEELLAVVAHDLRSPLQVISLTASLLQHGADTAQLPHVSRIATAAAAMTRLVDELLATHSVGLRSESHRARIDACRLLSDAADAIHPVVARAGLQIRRTEHDAGRVHVDHALMLRALCNLIGNCVKYCPAGTTIHLQSRCTETGVLLTVSDDGPGMSEESLARAFEAGWQGADAAGRNDGAGLGLSIVQTLVEKDGGTVEIRSVLGRGTTVSITLPIA